MKRLRRSTLALTLLIFVLTVTFFVSVVLAHSPLIPGNNESLETAMEINDPSKSWAIYAELHEGGEAQYYRFNISQGQRIYISLIKSTAPEDKNFLPGFVLMGPGITNQTSVPSYVEIPEGSGTLLLNGTQPSQATYEPFSPGSFYALAEVDINAPTSGTFYIAVFEPSQGGHYGLAVGYVEEYTLEEWILIPISLVSVYQWEGQSLLVIFAPMAITIAAGLGLIVWMRRKLLVPRTLFAWIGALAGLSFLGTGVTTLFQMVLALTQAPLESEVILTLIFALMPILWGIIALRLSLKSERKVNLRRRVYLAVIGVVALFTWAGLLFGPALAIVASFLPSRSAAKKPSQPN